MSRTERIQLINELSKHDRCVDGKTINELSNHDRYVDGKTINELSNHARCVEVIRYTGEFRRLYTKLSTTKTSSFNEIYFFAGCIIKYMEPKFSFNRS